MNAEQFAELMRLLRLLDLSAQTSAVDPRIREPLVIKDSRPPSVSKDSGWD